MEDKIEPGPVPTTKRLKLFTFKSTDISLFGITSGTTSTPVNTTPVNTIIIIGLTFGCLGSTSPRSWNYSLEVSQCSAVDSQRGLGQPLQEDMRL